MSKIDPKNITKFDRSDEELQNFWLFCTFVAGKNADIAADKLSKFLSRKPEGVTPFDYLRENLNDLHNMLVAHRVGQYGRLERAIKDSLDFDLRNCTIEDLEKVHGVGPKTARMFILHTRKDARCAVLDVHILRWLQAHFELPQGPSSTVTPHNAKRYTQLENLFINLASIYYRGIPLADVDLLIWSQMSGRLDNDNYEPTLPHVTE